jgi:hypothetical protein
MKTIINILLTIVLLFSFGLLAVAAEEGPDYAIATGASFNPGMSTPEVSGNFLFAKKVATKTYSFTFVDIVSRGTGTFSPVTSITEGVGIETVSIGDRVKLFATTGAGIVLGGDTTVPKADTLGYSWNIGPAMSIKLGKGWFIMPNARYFKSGLTDSSWVGGILVGWGK